MKTQYARLNVGLVAIGFGAASLIIILPMWIGGGMFYDGGMFHGSGMMGQRTMWSNGEIGSIGTAILFVAVAASLGALVAIAFNALARKS